METYLLVETARKAGLQPYQITYALATGKIPEPARIGGRRVFTNEDIEIITAVLRPDRIKDGSDR